MKKLLLLLLCVPLLFSCGGNEKDNKIKKLENRIDKLEKIIPKKERELSDRSFYKKEESKIQNYFSPILLSKIQIQLFAWNNELFDSQNSDNSFEFEITMVKDKRLLA